MSWKKEAIHESNEAEILRVIGTEETPLDLTMRDSQVAIKRRPWQKLDSRNLWVRGQQDTECEEYSVEKKHKGIKKKNQGGRGCGKTVVGKLVPRQDCKWWRKGLSRSCWGPDQGSAVWIYNGAIRAVLAKRGMVKASRSRGGGEGDCSEQGIGKTSTLKGQEPGPCEWPPCLNWKACARGPSWVDRLSTLPRTTRLVLCRILLLDWIVAPPPIQTLKP